MKINGVQCYLGRAVDHEGEVLEVFATKTRDKKSSLRFLKKAIRLNEYPRVIVTDRLREYGAALKKITNSPAHETGHRLNNRAENSHLPFRRREHAMLGFRKAETLKKFIRMNAKIYNYFNLERHFVSGANSVA